MAKGYWVVAWRSISDQAAFKRYVPPAAAAIHAHGGREIARGLPAKAYPNRHGGETGSNSSYSELSSASP